MCNRIGQRPEEGRQGNLAGVIGKTCPGCSEAAAQLIREDATPPRVSPPGEGPAELHQQQWGLVEFAGRDQVLELAQLRLQVVQDLPGVVRDQAPRAVILRRPTVEVLA